MNIAWLELFREVAARGSLTAAGEALGYPQPSVSRQVAALEAAVGGVLFERLPRGVRLTEEGRCLLVHAEAVLARMRAARDDLEALRDLESGRLRAGAIDSANTVLMPRALAAFRAAHPRVSVSVAEGTTPTHLDRLRNGELDIAVTSRYPDQSLEPDGLDLHHLMADPLLVALPAHHPRAGSTTLRLTDLAGESWVEGFAGGSHTLTGACERAGFQPRIDFAVRDWSAKQGFVAAGLGLTLVPTLSAHAIRPDIVLRPLHPRDAPIRQIHAATRPGNPSPAVTAFLTHLATAARDLQAASY